MKNCKLGEVAELRVCHWCDLFVCVCVCVCVWVVFSPVSIFRSCLLFCFVLFFAGGGWYGCLLNRNRSQFKMSYSLRLCDYCVNLRLN